MKIMQIRVRISKIEVLKKNAKWYWRVVSSNGKLFCHSEQFHSKGNAITSAKRFSRFLKNPKITISNLT